MAAQILGARFHRFRNGLVAKNTQRIIERNLGRHQGGEFSRKRGQLSKRGSSAGKKLALPPVRSIAVRRLHLKWREPLGPEQLRGGLLRRRIYPALGELPL